MKKLSNYWDRRAIIRLSSAEKTGDEYINRIKKIYDQAYRNINKENRANPFSNYKKKV